MAFGGMAKQRVAWLLVGLAVAAMVVLYFVGLLYIQFLIVIWSVVIILAMVVYDKDRHRTGSTGSPGTDRRSQLSSALADIDDRLSKTDREDVRQLLRRQRTQVEHDMRRLEWSARESEMAEGTPGAETQGLRPFPREAGWWEKRRQSRRETAHLRECLNLASEVLESEKGEAARESMKAVANDLRAHYDMLRTMRPASKSLADYRTAWGVLVAISQGTSPGAGFTKYASRTTRSRLQRILRVADSKGLQTSNDTPQGGSIST
jgi:hypothetical protein